MYVVPTRAPKCRCGSGISGWPCPVAPITCPRTTGSPSATETPDSHEYVVRTPSGWSMDMNREPPTHPAKATTPS